jgi:hypothetical protein
MTGYGKKCNIIYIIDFGLTKKIQEVSFNNFQNNTLSKKKMAGTPIYASINAHLANGGNPY